MIFLLDQLVSSAGQGKSLHDLYLADYAPGATTRGMTLEQTLVSPPLWLTDGVNRLFFLWSLADTAAFWRKNNLGRRDPEVVATWARIDALCESRRRDTLADLMDFTALADV